MSSGSKPRSLVNGDQLIFPTQMDESHTLFQMFQPKYKTNVNILFSVSHFHIVDYLSTSAAKAHGSCVKEASSQTKQTRTQVLNTSFPLIGVCSEPFSSFQVVYWSDMAAYHHGPFWPKNGHFWMPPALERG